jgi:hypothetical protein
MWYLCGLPRTKGPPAAMCMPTKTRKQDLERAVDYYILHVLLVMYFGYCFD